MTFLEKLQTIERVDQLIRLKATGNAIQLANRLKVSRSTVFELLKCMKAMGADIAYNDHRKSYYYKTDKELTIGFVSKKHIQGGKSLNLFLTVQFFRTLDL